MWKCGNGTELVEQEKKTSGISNVLKCESERIVLLITAVTQLSTVCPSATHNNLLLPGRPRKTPARKNVEMEMEHRLTGPAPVIDNHSIPFFVKAFVLCNFSRGEKEMADQFPIGFGHTVDLGKMLFGNHEQMHRCLGINIFKCGDGIILKYDF